MRYWGTFALESLTPEEQKRGKKLQVEQGALTIRFLLTLISFKFRCPPPRIINLSNPRISILPQGEEFANHRLRNIMSGLNLVETKHS